MARWTTGLALVVAAGISGATALSLASSRSNKQDDSVTFSNPSGAHRTVATRGRIDTDNPFFQDLGTNGRSCFSCHRPAQAWTITPGELRSRFETTAGLDPIFRNNDGSNCEGADVSTISKRRRAFSLLLTKGLIRVGLEVPANAEFEVIDVDDPYGCGAALSSVSMYRRPLPSTNLVFLSTVMWDGRHTAPGHSIRSDLIEQAAGAVTGHAQGAPPSPVLLRDIVDFQLGLFTTQERDDAAGPLHNR